MKKTLLFALASLSALALATGTLMGSRGEGVATTADGRVGGFNYRVTKATGANGQVAFDGKLRFEQKPNASGPFVLIEMGKPSGLGVVGGGKVCEFAGPGVLVRLVNGQRKSFPGRAIVRVADLARPHSDNGLNDTFRIVFEGERDLRFAFDGKVRQGDLEVFSHPTD